MNNTDKGISIIEILIGIVFLAVLAGPIMGIFSQSVSGTMMNRDEILASDYAADLISVAETMPYDELPLVENLQMQLMFVPGYKEKPMEEGFKRFVTIKENKSKKNEFYRYKTIQVEVEWSTGDIVRSIKLASLIVGGEGKP